MAIIKKNVTMQNIGTAKPTYLQALREIQQNKSLRQKEE
jgi:hypothetical protein